MVSSYSISDDAYWISIIMEYADGGDLFQKINEQKKKGVYIHEKEVWNVAIQILKGRSPNCMSNNLRL